MIKTNKYVLQNWWYLPYLQDKSYVSGSKLTLKNDTSTLLAIAEKEQLFEKNYQVKMTTIVELKNSMLHAYAGSPF